MRVFKIMTAAVLLAMPGWSNVAYPAAPATPPPSAAAGQDPLQNLLPRLNSTDPAQRAAAQKQLATITELLQQPEIIQKLLDATADPELKTFFQDRLDQFKAKEEEKRIASLPPISLAVNNASLAQVTEALNAALNTSLNFQNTGNSGGTFTLDVKDQPFWEVVTALQKQQPFNLVRSISGLTLTNLNVGLQRRYAIDGPAIAYINTITYQRTVNLQSTASPTPASNFTVSVMLAADPRLRILRFAPLKVTTATDDEGRNLMRTTGLTSISGPIGVASTNNLTTLTINLNPPPTLGKTLTLNFESALSVALSASTKTINDVANNLNTPIATGTRSVQVTRFTVLPSGQISMTVSATQTTPARGATVTPILVNLLDSTGKSLWSYTLSGGVGTTITATGSTGPYKLEVSTADKTIDLPVRFQFKDILMP